MNDDFDFPDLYDPDLDDHTTGASSAPLYTPQIKNPTPNSWPPKLVFDLALGLDNSDEIANRYGISMEDLDRLFEFPKFRQEVALLTRELTENNTKFMSKAKVQAETYLDDMHLLMVDAATSPKDKIEIFKTLAKLADLEPKPLPTVNPMFPGPSPGGTTRMVVEWVGGPVDHSNRDEQQEVLEMSN